MDKINLNLHKEKSGVIEFGTRSPRCQSRPEKSVGWRELAILFLAILIEFLWERIFGRSDSGQSESPPNAVSTRKQ